jgi:hypothetical protein
MTLLQNRLPGMLAILMLILMAGSMALAQGDGQPSVATPFYEISDDPDLNARMDHVEAATSILRGLEPAGPVTRAIITRDQLLDYLTSVLDRDYPPQAARDDVIFYNAFAFMPLDTDLRQVQLEVLTEQVGGFYDSDLEAMFVITSSDDLSALSQILYAHEFTHVLQDQHYDLDAMGLENEQFARMPDTILARQALVEGDAMLMTEGYEAWLLRQNPAASLDLLTDAFSISTEVLVSAPAIVQAELMFPYTDGRSFAYALFVAGNGWQLVNDAYGALPLSTEQIMHPEAYFDGEMPVDVAVVALDPLLGDGWREVWHRTLGEFYLREHLREQIDRRVASSAAEGWGGDRYRLYFNDETAESVLIWRTVWDTPDDAGEFADIYTSFNLMRFHGHSEQVDAATSCWFDGEVLCMRTSEMETLVVMAPQRSLAMDILALTPAED